MAVYLRYAAASHKGFDRENNEDSLYASRRLLALADGVGGHAAGEIASTLVISELARLDQRGPQGNVLDELRGALERANQHIAEHVRTHRSHAGMGTTVTALLFEGEEVGLVHVGDSRAYLLRKGSLTQLTKDETLVQSLVDEGRLTPEAASTDPRSSIVLRALDGQAISPATDLHTVQVGDRYLVCSDGVSDVLRPGRLAVALLADDPQQIAGSLVNEAMRAGSHDNVSCVAAFVTDRDPGYNIPLMYGAVQAAVALDN